MVNGIINIYKEAGFTSHDVVAKMRGILKQKKIGHTGTLDPQAVGVLPVCLGNATKLCDLLTDRTKEYEAVLRLGVVTDTQDMTGTILKEAPVRVTEQQAQEAVLSFLGEYDQIPPMYSALKVNGQKLYDLARQGKTVERQARRVEISSLRILSTELPLIRFTVECSKGTYIRTLCQDIGDKLGCGGVMESLKRTRVGNFYVEDAVTLTELEQLRDEGRIPEIVLGVEDVFERYPKVFTTAEGKRLLLNGNVLRAEHIRTEQSAVWEHGQNSEQKTEEDSCVRVYDEAGVFFGIYEYYKEQKLYKPWKMFLPGV